MNKTQRLIDYLLLTGFVWGMYLLWLVPFQLVWVGMNWEMFVTWVTWGTLLEMIFTYPIAKASIRYGPSITAWVKRIGVVEEK